MSPGASSTLWGSGASPCATREVLALGVTYKPDVGDLRESAAVETLAQLARRGVQVSYHDPFVPRLTSHQLSLRRSALTAANLAAADLVVVLTPHSTYDLEGVPFQVQAGLRRSQRPRRCAVTTRW